MGRTKTSLAGVLGLAAALLAISAGTSMTPSASAAPIIIRDTITSPIFETGLPHDCRPDLTGTIVGTINFDDDNDYTIAGTGTVTVQNAGIGGSINVINGSAAGHTISAALSAPRPRPPTTKRFW